MELGLDSSTFSREIRRNATADDPEQAHVLSDHRRRTATMWTKRLVIMMAAITGRLREERSPQQISSFMAPLVDVSAIHQ